MRHYEYYAHVGFRIIKLYAFIYYCYQNGNNNKDHLHARIWPRD
jgi:hypothetical protein